MVQIFIGISFKTEFVGNKAKGRISKRVFQENKARQILQNNKHFLPPDTHTYVLFQRKPLTMMKNPFYFILRAPFVLKLFKSTLSFWLC